MITRAAYVMGRASHREYYGQFVEPGLIAVMVARFGIQRLRASTDPNFNDIPLALWDQQRGIVEIYAEKAHRAATGHGMSLSDCVCIAKEAARQAVERAP